MYKALCNVSIWTIKIQKLSLVKIVKCHKLLFFYSHAAILLPLPAPVLALMDDNYQYTISTFPVYICMSQDPDFVFYSMVLVIDILLGLGVCLFILMLWIVHKVHRINLSHVISDGNVKKSFCDFASAN